MGYKIDLTDANIPHEVLDMKRKKAMEHLAVLRSGSLDMSGWIHYPSQSGADSVDEIVRTAGEIRGKCDTAVILGAGGSYVGARALIELMADPDDHVEIVYAGHDFSARKIRETVSRIRSRECCLIVISKSGGTAETLVAYDIVKAAMVEKYGQKGTAERTYIISEDKDSPLSREAAANGIKLLAMPQDIGGRYSVLTAVGLLPCAVAGIDIAGLIEGARTVAEAGDDSEEIIAALNYAATRNFMYERDKVIEVYSSFDPYLNRFGEWLKQLFGESEGKDGKGIYPSYLSLTRDLHSMGQYLQDGSSVFFETVISCPEPYGDEEIPKGVSEMDSMSIEQLNTAAEKGMIKAHANEGVPIVRIEMEKLDEKNAGALIYMFEIACAVSAMMLGVDPFSQPGVEAYKKEMKSVIDKRKV